MYRSVAASTIQAVLGPKQYESTNSRNAATVAGTQDNVGCAIDVGSEEVPAASGVPSASLAGGNDDTWLQEQVARTSAVAAEIAPNKFAHEQDDAKQAQ